MENFFTTKQYDLIDFDATLTESIVLCFYLNFDKTLIVFAALMKLSRAAPLSKLIRTICLPEAINSTNNDDDKTIDKEECIASGWGRSGPSPSLSNALLEASVPILNLEDCQRAYGKGVPIGPGHLCAGHTDGSSGSCVVRFFRLTS